MALSLENISPLSNDPGGDTNALGAMINAAIGPGFKGDILALLVGAILPLAFSPFDLTVVAVISPALLFMLWLHVTPRRAFWRGALYGLGMFGVGATWIFVSIHDFGHVSVPLSLFLTGLFVVVLASFPAVLGFVIRQWFPCPQTRLGQFKMVLVMPAAWTLFEWIRGWFMTGFPWLNLGYSQIETSLAGLAPIVGVYGVSWAVALSAALVALLVLSGQTKPRLLYATALVLLWGTSSMVGKLDWTSPSGAPIQVSLLQGNIDQNVKWHPQFRQPTIDLYTQLTREHWNSDLIVWPESALPVFYDEAKSYLHSLGQEARANGSDLLLGLLYQDAATERYYNSMISVGRQEAFYHKRHLVPFTEYLPFKEALAGIVDFMEVPMSDFSAGEFSQSPLEVAGIRAAISICYEDAFGEELISALPEANLLVNVSNDAWFGKSIAPHQHLQIARMRALETGRPLLRATNTGVSAIVAPDGSLQAVAPQFQVYALTAMVQAREGATPYVIVGNFMIIMVMVILVGVGWKLEARS